jgi:hypothetical protein
MVFAVYHAGTLSQKGKTAAALSRAARAEQIARDNAAAATAARADAERLARVVTDATEAFARNSALKAETTAAATRKPTDGSKPDPVGNVLDVLGRRR